MESYRELLLLPHLRHDFLVLLIETAFVADILHDMRARSTLIIHGGVETDMHLSWASRKGSVDCTVQPQVRYTFQLLIDVRCKALHAAQSRVERSRELCSIEDKEEVGKCRA